jgi:hypothetical protein
VYVYLRGCTFITRLLEDYFGYKITENDKRRRTEQNLKRDPPLIAVQPAYRTIIVPSAALHM